MSWFESIIKAATELIARLTSGPKPNPQPPKTEEEVWRETERLKSLQKKTAEKP